MFLSYYAICDPGRVRAENQDNIYCNGLYRRDISDKLTFRCDGTLPCDALFVVADGMGGEANGAVASFETVRGLDCVDHTGGSGALARYIVERNDVICELIRANDGIRMGSTFAGLLIRNKAVHIANIGDSRIFLARSGSFEQISHDHTTVQSKIDMGILTPEAARTRPDRHKLSQHLGIFPNETIIEPYTSSGTLQVGDTFLLCSDGLTDMVNDTQIAKILFGSENLSEKAEHLLSTALQNGGKDNISIVLVKIEEDHKPSNGQKPAADGFIQPVVKSADSTGNKRDVDETSAISKSTGKKQTITIAIALASAALVFVGALLAGGWRFLFPGKRTDETVSPSLLVDSPASSPEINSVDDARDYSTIQQAASNFQSGSDAAHTNQDTLEKESEQFTASSEDLTAQTEPNALEPESTSAEHDVFNVENYQVDLDSSLLWVPKIQKSQSRLPTQEGFEPEVTPDAEPESGDSSAVMPNVVGMGERDAVITLQEMGLSVTIEDQGCTDPASSIVISQSLLENTEVKIGAAVVLVCSPASHDPNMATPNPVEPE